MSYQPRWVGGREVGTGRRDAAGRYRAIAEYLGDMRDFHALDLGAYGGYFSFRLAEEFDAHCVAVDDFSGLADAPGVKVIRRRLSMSELVDLGPCDVVLCLSVLHHLPDWRAYLNALQVMAPVVFVETSNPAETLPKAKAHGDAAAIHAAVEAAGGKVLTTTPGYDARHSRPLWVIDRRTPAPAAEETPADEADAATEAEIPEPPKPAPVKRTRRRATKAQ